MDELSLYGRALSQAEVQALYQAGSAGKCLLNHPPLAGDAFVKALRNQVTHIPAYRFLDDCLDPDGDPLNLSAVTSLSMNGGSVVLDTDGAVYVPPTNYLGSDSFQYTISDGHGGTASARMVVLVESREAAAAAMAPPTGSTGGMQIRFSGFANSGYLIQRAETLSGPWVTVGTVMTDQAGTASFVDPNPPARSAYYRAVFP